MFHLQMMRLGLKSACCKKSLNHLTLKMLGVYSYLQDQYFWLLNHSIPSWNERVMIKTRNKKSWRNFCTFFFNFSSLVFLEGRMKVFKRKEEGRLSDQLEEDTSLSPVRGVWASWGRGMCGPEGHGLLTGSLPNGLRPWLTSLALLTCSSAIFGHPNSNPSSDYEPWLPHTRGQLRKFTRRLRIQLDTWWRRQYNVWERKVA